MIKPVTLYELNCDKCHEAFDFFDYTAVTLDSIPEYVSDSGWVLLGDTVHSKGFCEACIVEICGEDWSDMEGEEIESALLTFVACHHV